MAIFKSKNATGKWWVDHSLSIVLIGVLILMTTLSMLSGYQVYMEEDTELVFLVWYAFEWLTSTLADSFGLVLIIILSKYFFERNSDEDNDDAKLKREHMDDTEGPAPP